jgi:tripartite ATP-independent transporter DctP family solute receptor
MRLLRLIAVLLIGIMALALAGCGGGDKKQQPAAGGGGDKIAIKLAGTLPKGHAITDACFVFKDELEKLTKGKVEVRVFPNLQLGGGREIIEGVQMGTIQMCESSLAPMAGFNKTFLAFNLPYLFPSRDAAYKFLDGPLAGSMKTSVEAKGFKILEYWDNGYRHLTNSKRPVKSPADLAGLKIRTMENPVHMEAFRQMGANPTPMAFGEVFTALQQGAIDGQENAYNNITSMKFQEVQKYVTETGHFYDVTAFIINPDFYNKLPKDIQDAIKQAARTATEYQRKRSIEDDSKQKEVVKKSSTVIELTEADRANFKEAAKGTYEVFKKDIGEDQLKKIIDAINEAARK